MQSDREYGFLCVNGNNETLYLAPHGLGEYQVISGSEGAAVFEKSVALEMISDNDDLFYVPVNTKNIKVTTITDPDQWHQMNAPKNL